MEKSQLQWLIRLTYILFLIFAFFFIKDPYDFIFLNTLLAYIPIELAFHLENGHLKHNLVFIIILIIWLLFYPNNPYLFTDLFHLSLLNPYDPVTMLIRESTHIWIYFVYLVGSVIISTIIGFATLPGVVQSINQRFFTGSRKMHAFITEIILFLTGIGIYIGRFLRIHTVYLLDPRLIIKPLSTMWNLKSWAFFLIMFILLNLIYLSLWLFVWLVPKINSDND